MTSGQPGLYLLFLLLGLVYSWRSAAYRLAFLWAFAVPIIAFVINLVLSVYTPRYVTYLTIGFALATAVGILVLPRHIQWPALIVFAGINLWSMPSQFSPRRIPYRDFYQQIAREALPDDVVFIDHTDPNDNVVLWQMTHYLPSKLFHNLTTDINEARKAQGILYITSDWFNDDVRANFAKLEPEYPVKEVIGDCNRYWCYLIQLMG